MRLPTTESAGRRRPAGRLLTAGLALAVGAVLVAPVAAMAQPAAVPAAKAPAVKAPAAAVAKAAATVPVQATPRTLKQGMSGADVKALQQKLISLKYYDLSTANGVFGKETHHAVVAFQKHHGLGRDGIVGPITRGKLAAPSTPRPRVTRSGVYYWEINLTKQVMYSFYGSKVSRIINISSGSGRLYTTPSGGTARAITPTGTFRIQRKINGWRQSDLGLLYRPAYFIGGYAIHGSTSVPSYPASHGCVRTNLWTQDRIYNALIIGRLIYIYK
jgi:N-acetylmuramoyl-L-alanine amidase